MRGPPLDTPQTRVHTLPQTHDQGRICHGQQRETLAKRDLLSVQENDGLVGRRRKRRTDASDRIRDAAGKFVGLGRLQRDLDKKNLWRT